ncbi:MAG: carbamoyltransferase HypF [Actinobacteria bacterium]|nr:carbamoyltransferase HypF [Actinomycetota bacterium]
MPYLRINVKGIVQGVGFRPFVYRVAQERGVKGTVSNTTAGVDIRVHGDNGQVRLFLDALRDEAPPQAVIEELRVRETEPFKADSFEIVPSGGDGEKSVLVSPDLATCKDCVRELFDESDRRFRYPFINCTNCGPRFTIISDTPYDRPLTSMAGFTMCPDCEREYHDPLNRRYHAQPNACPACGPNLWLADREGKRLEGNAILEAARLLGDGKIVAIKGLGGFHLACDATSDLAVGELRARKRRYAKPLAVMVGSIEQAKEYCESGVDEEALLASTKSPIVLLLEKENSPISRRVAGRLAHQGLFLPYTPIHHLLMAEVGFPLIMTSGNVSSEPIITDNRKALRELSGIANGFLLHDRDILVRYDDSVTRVLEGKEYPIRRSRGYAPYPIRLKPASRVEVIALGAELKNTFCLLRGDQAFVSQHIGDMETLEELDHFNEALASMKRLFSLNPQVVSHDLHPDYLTTHMASDIPLPAVGVQHHHAHIVSCMADNRIEGEVIGVAWDGTGYGEDGTIWGGEFMLCDEKGYRRLAHLYPYPMPGSDACIYQLHRMAMGVLSETCDKPEAALARLRGLQDVSDEEGAVLILQLEKGLNSPLTSSAGRLFDVTAFMAGIRSIAEYDGQAACELEAVALGTREHYEFILDKSSEPWIIDTRPLFREIMADLETGTDPGEIAGKFHRTMALAIVETCVELNRETGIGRVALSGGVFQNKLLISKVVQGLRTSGLEPLVHHRVPCNDGGISLGQAVIAANIYVS